MKQTARTPFFRIVSTAGVAAPAPTEPSAVPPAKPLRLVYSASEACRLIRMNPAEFLAAIRTGELPAFRPGRRDFNILHEDLMAFARERARRHAYVPETGGSR